MVNDPFGFCQILLWPPLAQNDKIIGIPYKMRVVYAFPESFLHPRLIKPVEIEIRKQRRDHSPYTKGNIDRQSRKAVDCRLA
jgi:hypothetical protein